VFVESGRGTDGVGKIQGRTLTENTGRKRKREKGPPGPEWGSHQEGARLQQSRAEPRSGNTKASRLKKEGKRPDAGRGRGCLEREESSGSRERPKNPFTKVEGGGKGNPIASSGQQGKGSDGRELLID